MPEAKPKHTPEQKIVSTAMDWRRRDKDAIVDKGNGQKQRAEYAARKELRKVIDQAGVQP